MNNTTTRCVTQWLQEMFSRNGNPTCILSDNGSQFTSDAFAEFMRQRGIQHLRATVYTPTSNGKVEVFNRYLIARPRNHVGDCRNRLVIPYPIVWHHAALLRLIARVKVQR